MSGESNLSVLLRSMQPVLQAGEYVFCTIPYEDHSYVSLIPLCVGMFKEQEGLTLILPREQAEAASLAYSFVFSMITLGVHSSLNSVGFLAAITGKLADYGISVNPVSAYYHDHLFVPVSSREQVMKLLQEFVISY